MRRLSRGSQKIVCSAFVGLLVFGVLWSPAQSQAEEIRTVAYDCWYSNDLERTYLNLRAGVDLNDSGQVAFADHNGLYLIDLASLPSLESTPLPSPSTYPVGVVAEIGNLFDGFTNMRITGFSEEMRVNDAGVVTWTSSWVSSDDCTEPEFRSCGPISDPCSHSEAVFGNLVLSRRSLGGGQTGSLHALYIGADDSPRRLKDFDVMEVDSVVAAVFTQDPGNERAKIKLYDSDDTLTEGGSTVGSDYVVAGGAAPEGIGCYASHGPMGSQRSPFCSVTSGSSEPVAFSVKIEGIQASNPSDPSLSSSGGIQPTPGGGVGGGVLPTPGWGSTPGSGSSPSLVDILETIVSVDIDNHSVMDCDVMDPAHSSASTSTGHDWGSMIDLGCVECFGANNETVVHHIVTGDLADDLCVPTQSFGHPTSLAETDVSTVDTETLVLLTVGQQYSTLGGDTLSSLGSAVTASQLIVSGIGLPVGVAVFKGEYNGGEDVEALFVCAGVDEVYVLVEDGDALPSDIAGGGTFTGFSDPVVNNQGKVVFWASTSNENCGQGSNVCGGIFAIDLIEFFGTPAPSGSGTLVSNPPVGLGGPVVPMWLGAL